MKALRNCTHAWTDVTAEVRVEGLERPLRVLQAADVHASLLDGRDAAMAQALTPKMRKLTAERPHEHLETLLAEAPDMGLDLIALTGDILHFPSQANLEWLEGLMARAETPVLYVPGNHDWQVPGEPVNAAAHAEGLRRLERLTDGTPRCQVKRIGGVRFVALDNSTYQVDAEQVAFLRKQLQGRAPVVLLLHVPLSLPTLRGPVRDLWGAPILMGDPDWPEAARSAWDVPVDAAATADLLRVIAGAANLVAVLAGHVHLAHAAPVNPRAVQYVVRPPFEAMGHRVVDLQPMDRD